MAIWDAVKIQFGGTSTIKLLQLTLKFDAYKKQSNTMMQHLTVMSNMISEPKGVGHKLTDEQHVQVVIRFLPNAWEDLRINLTYNYNIKTFDDVAGHVKLEEDRLLTDKSSGQAHMTKPTRLDLSAQNGRNGKGKVLSLGNEETRPI